MGLSSSLDSAVAALARFPSRIGAFRIYEANGGRHLCRDQCVTPLCAFSTNLDNVIPGHPNWAIQFLFLSVQRATSGGCYAAIGRDNPERALTI